MSVIHQNERSCTHIDQGIFVVFKVSQSLASFTKTSLRHHWGSHAGNLSDRSYLQSSELELGGIAQVCVHNHCAISTTSMCLVTYLARFRLDWTKVWTAVKKE